MSIKKLVGIVLGIILILWFFAPARKKQQPTPEAPPPGIQELAHKTPAELRRDFAVTLNHEFEQEDRFVTARTVGDDAADLYIEGRDVNEAMERLWFTPSVSRMCAQEEFVHIVFLNDEDEYKKVYVLHGHDSDGQ
jgi:hypothetical protein